MSKGYKMVHCSKGTEPEIENTEPVLCNVRYKKHTEKRYSFTGAALMDAPHTGQSGWKIPGFFSNGTRRGG